MSEHDNIVVESVFSSWRPNFLHEFLLGLDLCHLNLVAQTPVNAHVILFQLARARLAVEFIPFI